MADKGTIGQAHDRLEGPLKVTGSAKYAGEYDVENLLYGYIVNSTITKGKILSIQSDEILALPGVIDVITHKNKPDTAWLDFKYADMDAPPGLVFKPLKDNIVKYNGQPIALVVAESFEMARFAAHKLKIEYEEDVFETNMHTQIHTARDPKKGLASMLKPPPPKPKGNFAKVYEESEIKNDHTFIHGTEHHNPMEMFASTVQYLGNGKLKIYDKTQGTVNSQMYVANVFGLKMKDVEIVAPFVGGAFGSGLRPQQQLFFAVLAALHLKRNVRVTLDRSQMYMIGHRPPTVQHTKFSTDKNGKLNAMFHEAFGETSQFEDYIEIVVNWSNMLYPAENTQLEHKIVPLDVYSPMDMRAPGGSTGMHAIEVAMDDLAYKLNMDPVELRLENYTEIDRSSDKRYSSKELIDCFLKGAKQFGWEKRNPQPRSMKRGNKLVGYGMATGMWDANRLMARAEALLNQNGTVDVSSAVTDIGVGSYTIFTQIAAAELGLSTDQVTFNYGSSKLPFAPIQGGSFTTATVGSAVKSACEALKKKLYKISKNLPESQFASTRFKDVEFKDGNIFLSSNPDIKYSYKEIALSSEEPIKTKNSSMPNPLTYGRKARAVHSAVFVEVEVDEELGVIEVKRALTAVAAGKIINPKTAESQVLGGMIWGISKTLHEETLLDHQFGRYMNKNLAEYHIPVHADIQELEVIFVEEEDKFVNDLGVKGVGEIGGIGMPPAITNAIYHATGKRICNLPIHFDELI